MLPCLVVGRDFTRCLACGVLAHGFARLAWAARTCLRRELSLLVASLALALRTTLEEQTVLLRTLAVSAAFTCLLQFWKGPVPRAVTAALSLLATALVLQRSFAAFVAVNGVSYVVTQILQSSRQRWHNTVLCLCALATLFLVARHHGWGQEVVSLGSLDVTWFYFDMWMFLRLFVLFWEIGAGKRETPSLLSFLGWATSPLFLAGPLLRCSQWPKVLMPETALLRDSRWWRKALGGLAMAAAGLAVMSVMRARGAGVVNPSVLDKVLIVFLFGPWGFYFTIAGAFLFIEALARLNGITIGPSFEKPFFQRNIAEFWARWNMTATSVFREYFFYNRWGRRTFNPYVNALVVFLAVGLWHGSNVYWICFGLLHALYFGAYLWFRSHSGGRVVRGQRILSGAVTYVCVCLAWYIPSKVAGLFQR